MTAVEPAGRVRNESSAWGGLVVAILAMAMLPLAVTGTNLAFGEVEAHFDDVGRSTLSWILSGYSIVIAAFTLLGGQLSDRLGSRRMFLLGLAVFGAASVLAGLAPAAPVLIAARAIQGVGGALIVPSSLSMALNGVRADQRAMAIGVWTAAFPIGSSVAPTLAALILEAGGWRWVFLTPVPLAAVLLGVALVQRPVTRPASGAATAANAPPAGRADLMGILMGTSSVGLAALGIVQGPRWGWTAWSTMAALGTSVALIPLFVARSRSQIHPLIPLHLFSVRSFRSANVANIGVSMVGMSVWLLWPLQMRQVWGYSQLAVGVAMTPTPALGGGLSILAARYAARHGYRNILLLGSATVALANVWFIARIGEDANYWTGLFPGLVLFGLGMGLTFAPLNGAALIEVPHESFGQANATFSTGRFLSGAVGIAAVIAALGDGNEASPLAPFDRAYLVLVVLSVAAWIVLAVAWPKDR